MRNRIADNLSLGMDDELFAYKHPSEQISMMRNRFSKALGLCFAILAVTASVNAESIKWAKTYKSALASAKASNKIVMIDFYTSWCKWCKVLDEKTYPDSKVVAASRQFSPLKIDAEKEGKSLAIRYGVHAFPKILFLDSSEHVVLAVSGYRPPEAFIGDMHKAQSNQVDAKRYRSALAHSPNDFQALVGMAAVSVDCDQLDKAHGYIVSAEKVNPKGTSDKLSDTYTAIAIQFVDENPEAAAACFEKAAVKAKDPNKAFLAYVRTGVVFFKGNRPDLAIAPLEASLKVSGIAKDKVLQVKEMLAQAKAASKQGH